MTSPPWKSGMSLVELVLAGGILAFLSMIIIVVLLDSYRNQATSETRWSVEEEGQTILDLILLDVRRCSRVLSPPLAAESDVLALRCPDPTQDPVIIGMSGSSIEILRHSGIVYRSPVAFTVSGLRFRIAGPDPAHQSVDVSFDVERSVHYPFAPNTKRSFHGGSVLPPIDLVAATACTCAAPSCEEDGFHYGYCEGTTCTQAEGGLLLQCAP